MLVVEDYGTQTSSITISNMSSFRFRRLHSDPMRRTICAADLKGLLRVFFESLLIGSKTSSFFLLFYHKIGNKLKPTFYRHRVFLSDENSIQETEKHPNVPFFPKIDLKN